MLSEFEGIDDWIPCPDREVLCQAVDSKAIRLERIALQERRVTSAAAAEHLAYRWKPSSPLTVPQLQLSPTGSSGVSILAAAIYTEVTSRQGDSLLRGTRAGGTSGRSPPT